MVNSSRKFEFSTFTHYEDTKDSAKCRKWGGLGWLGVTPTYRQHNLSIERI